MWSFLRSRLVSLHTAAHFGSDWLARVLSTTDLGEKLFAVVSQYPGGQLGERRSAFFPEVPLSGAGTCCGRMSLGIGHGSLQPSFWTCGASTRAAAPNRLSFGVFTHDTYSWFSLHCIVWTAGTYGTQEL